jgi:glycosyltransferase involved in cell wall biosynthesis
VLTLTVAIPTYNGSQRLPKLLEQLRSQLNPDLITWEILVVDNNSTDETATIIQSYQSTWVEPFPLRYCFEPEQGAAFARQRAIREAQGRLVGFLDDDNLPAPNWLEEVDRFAKQYPKAGAFSGQIHGTFEVEPPPNFKKIQDFLAIREHGSNPFRFEPDRLNLPPAAALVVRRQAWLESVPTSPILIGRVGKSMVGGEDYEVLLHLHKQKWEIWYNPQMHSYHYIPKHRLEPAYLKLLAHSCGLSTCQLRMITLATYQKPLIWSRTLLGNLRAVCLYLIQYRGRLKTELIPVMKLQFHLGGFLGCFWILKRSLGLK